MYVTGVSLRLFTHPLWIDFFQKIRPAFTLPNRQQLSNGLLDKEYGKMESEITNKLAEASDLHFQCDGWSNCRNESIINCVISQPVPLFVKFLDTKAESHNAEYLFKLIDETISQYDVNKFLVVIGDNAFNMQAALTLLNQKYPHIVSLGCVSHLMHLLCFDIMKCESAKKIQADVNRVIKKIKKSHLLNATFTAIQKDKQIQTALKLPGKTRWGSILASFESLTENRNVLEIMVVTDSIKDKLEPAMRAKILNEIFWVKVENIMNILRPVVAANIELEGDGVLIHKVHEHCIKMKTGVNEAIQSNNIFTAREKNSILSSLDKRLTQAVKPIHLAAALLHPVCRGTELSAQESIDAMEFIFKTASDMSLDTTIVLTEAGYFKNKEGLWNKEFIWSSAANMCPIHWWKSFYTTTLLSKIAVRILSAPTSSAATERANSTFGWIHNTKRNRLVTKRAGKITYLAHNWKLLNLKKNKNKRTNKSTEQSAGTSSVESTQSSESSDDGSESFVESDTDQSMNSI